jgi:ADP-ribosyl-[dinitrogen reductase] hydrolase
MAASCSRAIRWGVKNRNPLMLLRIAQGDAYGMAVEYIKPESEPIRQRALKFGYGRHPVHKLEPGQYTDDTQMSIAVAEVLLGKEQSTEDFANAFVRCFKRDPRAGYARGFQGLLESVSDGDELRRTIENDSDKNGAAMRAVPIGVLPKPADVVDVAERQAKITHDTIGGIRSAVLVALMSHYALYEHEPFADFPSWSNEHAKVVPGVWSGGPVQGPGVGLATADAVFTLVSTQQSLLKIAETAIRWGGDVDSVLAIAWGIASSRMKNVDGELPAFFERDLEDGSYGRRFLVGLGTRLMAAYS